MLERNVIKINKFKSHLSIPGSFNPESQVYISVSKILWVSESLEKIFQIFFFFKIFLLGFPPSEILEVGFRNQDF